MYIFLAKVAFDTVNIVYGKVLLSDARGFFVGHRHRLVDRTSC